MELRVLAGPQAGCCLPLTGGMYRAGADESCDVVLDGLPAGQIAFTLYVGQKAIALEAMAEGVQVEGRPARGLRELRPGGVFEFGPWLFAVDDPGAPWPQDVEALRGARDAGQPEDSAGELAESGEPADAPAPPSQESGGPEEGSAGEAAPSRGEVPKAARRRLPFWLLGLVVTAAFLGCGVLALALSLTPAKSAPAPDPTHLASALGRIAASAGGDVKLEHQPDGRVRLCGHVATRLQRTNLTRAARAVDPLVVVRLSVDEDLEKLARDALALFPNAGVEIAGLHGGRLTLTGHVAQARLRDQIVAAIKDGVPDLAAIDNQVGADDDALLAARELLAAAGLADRVTAQLDPRGGRLMVGGAPDDAQRDTWRGVRDALTARFGASLEIVEGFDPPPDALHPASPRPPAARRAEEHEDIVAVVMGPVPYVLLRDGSKHAIPTPARVH
jgi:type III secretion system YscD/HrpQ family protein